MKSAQADRLLSANDVINLIFKMAPRLIKRVYKYLLLTEFEGRTVSYGPRFFPPRFMAQARSARAINRRGKNEDP